MLSRAILVLAFTLVSIFGASTQLHAEWKWKTQGQYGWWESDASQSFPLSIPGIPGAYFHKTQGATANEWSFCTPLYIDPQTKEVRYRVIYTDGSRILERVDNQATWTEWPACDLAAMQKVLDVRYQMVQTQSQTDYRAYYVAWHFEADRLMSACKQIELRNSARR